VRLGIKHGTSNSSGSNKEDSSGNNNSNSPVREEGDNVDDSLLISVSERVISGGHVVISSSSVHLEDTSVKIVSGGVELSTVSNILFSIALIVSVGGKDLISSKAVLLVKSGKSDSSGGVFDEDLLRVLADPSISDGESIVGVDDLDVVRSIGLILSFSGISSWVSIATSPLEVDIISDSSVKVLRDKVVLNSGVSLDNVTSLSSDVQVEKSS